MAKTNRRQIDPIDRRQRIAGKISRSLERYANRTPRRAVDYLDGNEDDDFIADEISSAETNAAY